jgi:hypothetical protein
MCNTLPRCIFISALGGGFCFRRWLPAAAMSAALQLISGRIVLWWRCGFWRGIRTIRHSA